MVIVVVPAQARPDIQDPVAVVVLAQDADRSPAAGVEVVDVRLTLLDVGTRVRGRDTDLAVEVRAVPVEQLKVAVGRGHGMEVVAEAHAAVRLRIAAVLGNPEADVEARLGARHDRRAHRHGDRLIGHALPRPRTGAAARHARVGVVTDDAGGTILRTTDAGPQHLDGGDRDVAGGTDASLSEAGGVPDALPRDGRSRRTDDDEATRRDAEDEHEQTACRETEFPCAMCHVFSLKRQLQRRNVRPPRTERRSESYACLQSVVNRLSRSLPSGFHHLRTLPRFPDAMLDDAPLET